MSTFDASASLAGFNMLSLTAVDFSSVDSASGTNYSFSPPSVLPCGSPGFEERGQSTCSPVLRPRPLSAPASSWL